MIFLQELVEAIPGRTQLAPTFYVFAVFYIVIVLLILFFIIKLKQRAKQIIKGVGISFLITFILEALFYVVGSFLKFYVVFCEVGYNCPSQFQIYFEVAKWTFVPLFLIVLFIYYLVLFLRRK